MDGYPEEREPLFVKHKDYFIQNFKPDDLDEIKDILEKMRNTSSCAVHERRGIFRGIWFYSTVRCLCQ